MPRYFAVRALGQDDAAFSLLFEKEIVAVGWSDVDFSQLDQDATVEAVYQRYYADATDASPTAIGRRKAAVRRFKSISKGDYILVPFGSSVRLATAEGREIFDPEAGKKVDLANQHAVTYLKEPSGELVTVPRARLPEGLQRRLRVRGSIVSDLGEFADDIDGIFQYGERSWATQLSDTVGRQEEAFRDALLENLCSGRTQLKAGGAGLEELVRELLEIEGYEAKILGKRAFAGAGDADIIATRADPLVETKLLVQVKHHQGESGQHGAIQLAEILNNDADAYEDYSLVIITSAVPGQDLLDYCEEHDITIVTGSELVAWIYERIDELGIEWKTRLGISTAPQMAV